MSKKTQKSMSTGNAKGAAKLSQKDSGKSQDDKEALGTLRSKLGGGGCM